MDIEMPDIPWFGGILRVRDFAVLEWVYCVKPNPPQ